MYKLAISQDLIPTSNCVSMCFKQYISTLVYLLPVISSIYSKDLFLKLLVLQHTSEGFIINCKDVEVYGLQGDLGNIAGIAGVFCCLPKSSS